MTFNETLRAASVAVALLWSGSALAQTTLTVGFIASPQSPEAAGMRTLAEEVARTTDGRVVLNLQGGGALGGDRELLEGVQLGTIDMTISSTSVIANFVPALTIFDVPFLFRDFEQAMGVLSGPVGDEALDAMTQSGMTGLAMGGLGFRHLTNSIRPVTSVADAASLKIRTQQNAMHIDAWRELGALPTPMSITEVYTALQQGVIDGQENPISAIINNRFGEVQKHLSLTSHAFTPLAIVVSPGTFASLSEEDQAALQAAARNAMIVVREEVEKTEQNGLETLRGQGVTIVEDVDAASFTAKLEPLFAKFAEQFGEERINAIRNHQ